MSVRSNFLCGHRRGADPYLCVCVCACVCGRVCACVCVCVVCVYIRFIRQKTSVDRPLLEYTYMSKKLNLNIYLSTLIPQVTNAANTEIYTRWLEASGLPQGEALPKRPRDGGREGGGDSRGGKVKGEEGERRTQRRPRGRRGV